MIITHKKDIIAFIRGSMDAGLIETREALGHEWAEVERELVKEIQRAEHPPYGQDWAVWLKTNLEEMLAEAISIVL